MDWLNKIPNWIKIPLKILLPALFIFSGFLLLIDDNLAEKLYLKDFRQGNGFAFGIIFTITLSLILVYIIVFASKPIMLRINAKRYKHRIKKQIHEMQDAEKIVIYGLFNEPTHAFKFPMSDPTINLLKAKDFVFTYTQETDAITYFGHRAINYIIQPIVLECLQEMLKKIDKKALKIKKNIKKCKDSNKKARLQEQSKMYQNLVKNITSVSLYEHYRGEN